MLEIVSEIARVAGTDLEPDVRGSGNPEGEIDKQYVDASKIADRCGWRPQVSLTEGVGRTLDWYRENPEIRPERREPPPPCGEPASPEEGDR